MKNLITKRKMEGLYKFNSYLIDNLSFRGLYSQYDIISQSRDITYKEYYLEQAKPYLKNLIMNLKLNFPNVKECIVKYEQLGREFNICIECYSDDKYFYDNIELKYDEPRIKEYIENIRNGITNYSWVTSTHSYK